MIDFTSRQLRAFLLVAQHHSFTRAAEALFVTPSGLSVLIRELELQLGFRLFDRTTRHVALTAHGSDLLEVARQALYELDEATARIGRTARDAGDAFSVGAGLMMAANLLPPAITEFRRTRPHARIQLLDAEPTVVMQKVRAGTLDLGIGFFKATPDVRRTPFFRFSLMVIRPGSDPAPHRASITWSALRGELLILQAPPAPLHAIVERHLAHAGVDARRATLVNRLDTLIAMVEAGAGVGIVPSHALPACRRRQVATSRLTNPTVPIDCFLIRNRGRKLSPAAEEFTTFFQGYIARWAGSAGVL